MYVYFRVIFNMPRTFNTESLNSDTMQVGTDTFVVADNKDVGIGLVSPEYKLEVRSTDSSTLRLSRQGTANQEVNLVFEDGANNVNYGNVVTLKSFGGGLSFLTQGQERFKVQRNGSVGVNYDGAVGFNNLLQRFHFFEL